MSQYIYRADRIRKLKAGVSMKEYFTKHPDAIKISKPPCQSTLQEWDNEGYCNAIDGCRVEPDGTCEHNLPSWLMAMGWI